MAALGSSPYWYIGSTKWSSVTAWAASTAKTAGSLVRQSGTPTLGDERVFVCIVAGTTGGAQPSWTVTKGAKTTDNSVTWQECTGQPAVNGDVTNTLDWNSAKSNTVALGRIIKSIAATHYFICTTSGTAGSGAEPTWNTTAGQTTADGSVTWTCIGAVGSFGAWAAPHKRLPNATASTWGTSGDTFYISNNHAESQDAGWNSYLVASTKTAPCYYLCVTDTAAPPTALNTTATITTTTNNGFDIRGLSGGAAYFYMYGITFNSGTGSGAGSIAMGNGGYVFDSCGFNLVVTSASGIQLGYSSGGDVYQVYRNCTFTFANASQAIGTEHGNVEIIGGSIAATGTAPTTAFSVQSSGNLIVRDCNISGVTGNLVNVANSAMGAFIFANCRLGAGVTLATGSISGAGTTTLRVHNCDSAATNYRMYTASVWGTSQQSTSTYNNAGATDGTQRISWQIDTNSNPFFGQPFVSEQIFQWVDTTGSALTATVEIAGASSLNNDDIWMEIEYLGNASYPLGSVANCRKSSVLASNAAVTSSSASWTGSPAVTQKLQVSFTPQMKGPIKARIYVAKKTATVYVDPLITVA